MSLTKTAADFRVGDIVDLTLGEDRSIWREGVIIELTREGATEGATCWWSLYGRRWWPLNDLRHSSYCRTSGIVRELEAARKVIAVVSDRPAVPKSNIPDGVERVRMLVNALDEWVGACGGPEEAHQILARVRGAS